MRTARTSVAVFGWWVMKGCSWWLVVVNDGKLMISTRNQWLTDGKLMSSSG